MSSGPAPRRPVSGGPTPRRPWRVRAAHERVSTVGERLVHIHHLLLRPPALSLQPQGSPPAVLRCTAVVDAPGRPRATATCDLPLSRSRDLDLERVPMDYWIAGLPGSSGRLGLHPEAAADAVVVLERSIPAGVLVSGSGTGSGTGNQPAAASSTVVRDRRLVEALIEGDTPRVAALVEMALQES